MSTNEATDPQAYLQAVRAALARGLRVGTPTCTECGQQVDPHDEDHAVIGGIVAIGCEGYYMVNPALVGIHLPAWTPVPDAASATETTEYGAYVDPHGNIWRGVAKQGRSMDLYASASTASARGASFPCSHIVSTYGPLRPVPCDHVADDGGACIRPWQHDTACRSQPLA